MKRAQNLIFRPSSLQACGQTGLKVLWTWAFACTLAVAHAGEVKPFLTLDNEVVCWVNTEMISKRDIEQRMGMKLAQLNDERNRTQAAGAWNDQKTQEYDQQYAQLFREHLRDVIRERLMLQEAKESK